MIRINLLPPELRKKKKVPFIDSTLIFCVLVLIVILVLLYFVSLMQQSTISGLDNEIASAQRELQKYQARLEALQKAEQLKTELTNRMTAVQELENKRAYWIQIVTEFVHLIPDFLWIDKFEQGQNNVVAIEGKCYTTKGIATFLVNLLNSQTFQNISLGPISQILIGDADGYLFSLSLALKGDSNPKQLGTFVVDSAKVEELEKAKGKGMVESTRSKLGLMSKEESKKMFGGVKN
jgi:Tfp pilus assembly protein PilN